MEEVNQEQQIHEISGESVSRPVVDPVASLLEYQAEINFYCDHIFIDDIIYEVKPKENYNEVENDDQAYEIE